MCKRNILTIVAVAMLAVAIGQVQAETVTVDINGEFLMYKPGTNYTVLATFPPGGNSYAQGVGDNLTVIGDAIANYSDGTSGAVVDCPGWKILTGNNDLFGNGMDGSVGFNAFGTWSGGTGVTAESDSLGDIVGAIYTLSAMVNGSGGPLVLDLLAGGVALTPSSSITPALPTDGWQEISRTYDAGVVGEYAGQPMTIVLGTGTEDLVGTRIVFDNVSLSYELLFPASGPIPADEATDVARDVVLGWNPGLTAATRDVYFGETFDDVNDAVLADAVSAGQIATTYDPDRLDFGKTYYWRVDEVNAPPNSTVFPSEVWSFTVESIAYPIPSESITATASSQASDDEGPEKTIGGSGVDANDLHSADPKAMWISEAGDPGSSSIQYEFDKSYKLHEMLVWNYNGNSILTLYGLKEVTIEYSTDGTNWSQLENVPEFAQAIGDEGYAANTTVAFNGAVAKYVKITANSNWGDGGFFDQYGLSEIQFLAIPVAARKMNPADGTILPGVTVELSWHAGRQVEFHDVYISTDMQDVIDGIAPVERVNTTQYTAEFDLLGATYYWKVNEVNEAEVPAVWEGPVQSLTTSEFLVIENFDDYTTDNQIWWSWKDGLGYVEHDGEPTYTGNGTGSAVGDETTATFMEMNIVQGGTQSMPAWYDNNKQGYAKYSETALTLPAGKRDWTKGSPAELSLWFRGEAANTAERLYVAVSDTAVVYHEDLNAAQLASWTEWVIPLETLAGQGVSLTNVDSVAIGLGTRGNTTIPGGAGKMYFDEIQLHQDRSAIVPITVPNGDFEQIYKPGSDTITADLGDGWTQGLGPDTPMDDGIATYSDGTTGDLVDIPGWIGADAQGWIDNGGTYDRDTNFPNRQGSVTAQIVTPYGLYYYLSNGGDWGNAAGGLIVSDASLGNVEDGAYMLSMLATGGATPVILELLADGVALTPSSSVDPQLSGDWQEFSRTYDAVSLAGHIGESLTIRLGVGRGASGGQSCFDAVSLSYAP